MEQFVSNRLAHIHRSETLYMAKRSRELKEKGVDVIDLSIGQPDFHTFGHVKEAAKKAIDDNYSYYSPTAGFKDLREAIVRKLNRENGLDYTINQVFVSNGAKQSIANVVLSLINWYDEVVIPSPYWMSYSEIVKIAHGKNIYLPTSYKNDFKITPEQLDEAINPNTRLFMLNSPSNPAGTVYTRDELAALAEVLGKYEQIIVISDEIYEHINFQGKHESIAQFENIKDRVVVVNGVSKAYSMTGWRIGYIAGPEWIVEACEKLQGQYTSGASSIAQKASVAALNETTPGQLTEVRDTFLERRNVVIEELKKIPRVHFNVPQGAFYVFPDMSYYFGTKCKQRFVNNASDLSFYLLDEANVATVAGSSFGQPNCVRITYAASTERLIEGMQRINVALSKLKKIPKG